MARSALLPFVAVALLSLASARRIETVKQVQFTDEETSSLLEQVEEKVGKPHCCCKHDGQKYTYKKKLTLFGKSCADQCRAQGDTTACTFMNNCIDSYKPGEESTGSRVYRCQDLGAKSLLEEENTPATEVSLLERQIEEMSKPHCCCKHDGQKYTYKKKLTWSSKSCADQCAAQGDSTSCVFMNSCVDSYKPGEASAGSRVYSCQSAGATNSMVEEASQASEQEQEQEKEQEQEQEKEDTASLAQHEQEGLLEVEDAEEQEGGPPKVPPGYRWCRNIPSAKGLSGSPSTFAQSDCMGKCNGFWSPYQYEEGGQKYDCACTAAYRVVTTTWYKCLAYVG